MTQHNPDPVKAAAQNAVAAHLSAARLALDSEFGEGYAARHPELLAAMVQATAVESAVESAKVATAETLTTLRDLSRATNETILKLKPRLFG